MAEGSAYIELAECGPHKIEVIKLVRQLCEHGIGLAETKRLVESTPQRLPVFADSYARQREIERLCEALRTDRRWPDD